MSYFQRVKNIIFGVVMILFAVVLFTAPKDGYPVIAMVVSALVFLYGFRLLIYYFRMARHMVGGKATLCRAIIVLDLALVATTTINMGGIFIIVYLLGIFAFSGFVDILRAFEAWKISGSNWKAKFITGLISVLFAILLTISGVVIGNSRFIVYGFCLSLIYLAAVKIFAAFKRTAIVYIQ